MHDDRMKAMLFQKPEQVPVGVGILPAAWMKHREALSQVVARHPALFGKNAGQARDYDNVWQGTYVEGEHVDAWGCVWKNVHTGMQAMVTGHPVPRREDIDTLAAPEENIGFPHGFMYLRLADLRGFEEVMIDFAEEPPQLQKLIDTVLEYNMRQGRLRLEKLQAEEKTGSIVHFGDDLGMQRSLPMSPEKWRRYLKPCFAKIYQPFRDAGYYVYMHTDGHILEIIPDLVDAGVNVVNPQIRANGLSGLVDILKGKVCVDLDLDRQLMPFATPSELDRHVEEAIAELGSSDGGLWVKAEIGEDVPLENVEAILSALEKYRDMYSLAAK
jgi:hypothetical protein